MSMNSRAKINFPIWKFILITFIVTLFAVISLVVTFLLLIKKPDVDRNVQFNVSVEASEIDAVNTDSDGNIKPPHQNQEAMIEGMVYTPREEVYNFLVAGLHTLDVHLTDALMIVSFDVYNGSLSVLQIPRDTYINVKDHNHQINIYYQNELNRLAREGIAGVKAVEQAMESLSDFFTQNMNIIIDEWFLLDLKGFRNIVDIIGGVDIDVPCDMHYSDPEQDLFINLKAGPQTLNGDESEQFVRFRNDYIMADKGRIDAQKIFITAFLDTVKSKLSVSMVSKLITECMSNVKTSVSVSDCIYYAKEALSLDFSNVKMFTLPSSPAEDDGTGYMPEVMHRADTLKLINEYFNVYEQPITENIFDKKLVFTDAAVSSINNVYLKSAGAAISGYTAEEIDNDAIDIKLKK